MPLTRGEIGSNKPLPTNNPSDWMQINKSLPLKKLCYSLSFTNRATAFTFLINSCLAVNLKICLFAKYRIYCRAGACSCREYITNLHCNIVYYPCIWYANRTKIKSFIFGGSKPPPYKQAPIYTDKQKFDRRSSGRRHSNFTPADRTRTMLLGAHTA